VDKRKSHLSNLIASGQITREAAIERLGEQIYTAKTLAQETEFVIKKLALTDEEFHTIMKADPVPHSAYPEENKGIICKGSNAICYSIGRLRSLAGLSGN
jgi:hypothetical protein